MPSHCLPSKLLTSAPSSSSSSSCSAFASDVLFSSSLVSQKAGLRLTPRLASACFFSRRLFWRKDGGTGGIVSLPEIKGAAVIDDFLMGPLGGFSVEQLMEFAGLSVASSIAELTGSLSDRRA